MTIVAHASAPPQIDDALIAEVAKRLAAGKRVRRTLPDGGRVHIDRQLPFLVVYRPSGRATKIDLSRFVHGEASYLVAPKGREHRPRVAALVSAVAQEMVDVFGGFGIIEIWPGPMDGSSTSDTLDAPGFTIAIPRAAVGAPSVLALEAALREVRVQKKHAVVSYDVGRVAPPGHRRLATDVTAPEDRPQWAGVGWVGIEIAPVHIDPETGEEYPKVARSLHRQLSRAMQRTAYEFARRQTTQRPLHYQSLGRRAFVKAARDADRKLSRIASSFDLLLAVSPVNTEKEFRRFTTSGAAKAPRFEYRPLAVDPMLVKRQLYGIPIERVEDPTLEGLFREKQRELSLKLDLLADRNTKRFIHTGVALYGTVDASTLRTAHDLLAKLPTERDERPKRSVRAAEVAKAAEEEVAHYRTVMPEMGATVTVRDDVTSLMVSNGHVFVGASVRVPSDRVNALVQHEVGTHVVTFWNGSVQPFQLLSTGLAGHDELQEGFAVLAEHLVGGLTASRLRTLAARVLAAESILGGASFIETYRTLHDDYGFLPRTAFQVTTRVHRGGGLVKDAVYLRGLGRVVDYLARGGRLETLLVGKISVDHTAVIEELQRRGVLLAPPLRPAYLDDPDTHYRLERLRQDPDLVSLAEHV